MTLGRFLILSACSAALITLGSCTLAHRGRPITAEATPEVQFAEGKGNAYLFDIKINHSGKKNSVRLDLYQSGELLGLFARGYLGKGVMKGILSKDSLIVYFPTENEFYTGKISGLVENPCLKSTRIEQLILQFFNSTPPEIDLSNSELYLTVLKEENSLHEYLLQSRSCPEGIRLQYDLNKSIWFIKEIQLTSQDKSFEFFARRREFRSNIEIPQDKFGLVIPETALRITP